MGVTVRELIDLLEALPKAGGLEVVAEGCDCENRVETVAVVPRRQGKGGVEAAYVLLGICGPPF